MNYLWHTLTMIMLYLILGISLNLAVGYGGLLSLCHAAFYGIGAYACTLLPMKAGLSFWLALPLAMLISAAISILISWPSLRLKGDYFVLATLGFQVIVYSALYNWTSLTGGAYGIAGIPRPGLLGWKIDSALSCFVLAAVLAVATALVLWLVQRSPFGRALRAIRDDEVAAAALGKNVTALKVAAFAIAAACAAIPGGLFAVYVRYIDPTSFTVQESIFIISVVIIGGAGTYWGPMIGALLLVLLPEGLRFLHIPDAAAANLRQIIYGLLLVILMLFRPQGIKGEYGFD